MQKGGRFDVFVDGEIATGDAARLSQFLRDRKISVAMLVLNSPGGNLVEGLRIGQLVRNLGFDTMVGAREEQPALCASACAYAFAGGVNRYFDDKDNRLGLHQFAEGGAEALSTDSAQRISGLLVSYLTEMGVNALAFSVSATASPDEMTWLTTAEAEKLGFANNGTQPTTAEIKLSGMNPYLRLEQKRQEGHVRVLFLCDNGNLAMMAGVVTDPEQSKFHASLSQRSYLEIDGQEALVAGPGGAEAEDSVLWLSRKIDRMTLSKMLRGSMLEVWTEGGGAFRWGGSLDLKPVRTRLLQYASNCTSER